MLIFGHLIFFSLNLILIFKKLMQFGHFC